MWLRTSGLRRARRNASAGSSAVQLSWCPTVMSGGAGSASTPDALQPHSAMPPSGSNTSVPPPCADSRRSRSSTCCSLSLIRPTKTRTPLPCGNAAASFGCVSPISRNTGCSERRRGMCTSTCCRTGRGRSSATCGFGTHCAETPACGSGMGRSSKPSHAGTGRTWTPTPRQRPSSSNQRRWRRVWTAVEGALGDTTADPETAVAEARRLVEVERVHAIVGPNSSAASLPIAERVIGPSGVPTVSFSATSPALTLVADNEFFFRVALSDVPPIAIPLRRRNWGRLRSRSRTPPSLSQTRVYWYAKRGR